jgi:hypothetical protein
MDARNASNPMNYTEDEIQDLLIDALVWKSGEETTDHVDLEASAKQLTRMLNEPDE